METPKSPPRKRISIGCMSAIIGFIVAGIGTLISYMLLVPPPTGTGTMGYGLGGWFVAFFASLAGILVGIIGGEVGRVISNAPSAGTGSVDSEVSIAPRYWPRIGAFLGGLLIVFFFAVIFAAM